MNDEFYKRIHLKGTAKRISKENESIENACKRTIEKNLDIKIDRIGKDCEYESWKEALLNYWEEGMKVEYFIHNDVLYSVEQNEIPDKDKIYIKELENGDIEFEFKFDQGDDIYTAADVFISYYEGLLDMNENDSNIWDSYFRNIKRRR